MASEAAAKPLVGKGACLTQMLRERRTGVSTLVHSVRGRTYTYTGQNTVAGCRLPFKFAIPLSDCPPCTAPTVGQCTKRCSMLRLLEATSIFWAVSKSPIQAGCHSPLISDQVHVMQQVMDCSAAPDAVRCSGRKAGGQYCAHRLPESDRVRWAGTQWGSLIQNDQLFRGSGRFPKRRQRTANTRCLHDGTAYHDHRPALAFS